MATCTRSALSMLTTTCNSIGNGSGSDRPLIWSAPWVDSSSHAGRTLLPERSKLFKSHWSNQWLISNAELSVWPKTGGAGLDRQARHPNHARYLYHSKELRSRTMSKDEITRANLSQEEIIFLEKYDRFEQDGKDTPLSTPVSNTAWRLLDLGLLEPEGMPLARSIEGFGSAVVKRCHITDKGTLVIRNG